MRFGWMHAVGLLTLVVLAAFAAPRAAHAADCSSQNGGGNWDVASAWSCGMAPGPGDNVTITAGNPINTNGSRSANTVTVNASATLTVSSEATLSIYGDLAVNGTMKNVNPSTVAFVGDAAHVVSGASVTYQNLTIEAGNTVTINTTNPQVVWAGRELKVEGTLIMIDGAYIDANWSTSKVTMGADGVVKTADANGLTGSGSFGATFGTAWYASGTIEYNGEDQAVSAGTYQNLVISGSGTKTTGAVTVNGAFTLGAGTTTSTNQGILTLNGTVNCSGGIFGDTGFGVVYNASADQTVCPSTYQHLTIAGSGSKTLVGNVTVRSTLTLTSGSLAYSSFKLVMADAATIARDTGTLLAAPTFTNTIKVSYTGATAVTTGPELPTSPSVLRGLTINKAGGVTLGAPASLIGPLTLTNGAFDISGNTLTMGAGSTISRDRGSVTNTPTIYGTINLTYTGASDVTTGPELPTSATMLYKLTVNKTNYYNTVTLAGSATVNSTLSLTNGVLMVGSHTLTLNGPISCGALATVNSSQDGMVMYGAAQPQTVCQGTYGHLQTATGYERTLQGQTTVTGSLTVGASTTLVVGEVTLSVQGPTSVSGTLTLNRSYGSRTFMGDVTVNSGGAWSETAGAAVSFGGGLLNNGTWTASTGIHTFTGSGKTLGGANAISIPNAMITGSYTNHGRLTVGTALGGTGGLTQGTDATLSIGESSGITTLTAGASGNTVNYTGAAQAVHGANYHHLGLSGSGAKTLQAGTTAIGGNLALSGTANTALVVDLAIGGDLAIGPGTTLSGGNTTIDLSGNWTNNGAFTAGTGTVTLAGTTAQTLGGTSPTTFSNLVISKATGAVLATDQTVANSLALTSGDISTGDHTLTLAEAATTTGAGDVWGNVRRSGLVTGKTYSFGHPDVSLNFASGTPPTEVTVHLANAAPAGFANAVGRSYTITPSGGSGYAATVRLHYEDEELNGNTEADLLLWRHDGTAWQPAGQTARNMTANWVEQGGITAFSPWALSGVSPTAVTLSGMTASTQGEAIEVAWDTASEADHLGFNLYRATAADGPWTRLNAALIPAQEPGSPLGHHYTYLDAAGLTPGTTYWYALEDVSTSGATTRHAAVSVTYGGGPTAVGLARFEARPAAALLAALLAGLAAAVAMAVSRYAVIAGRAAARRNNPHRAGTKAVLRDRPQGGGTPGGLSAVSRPAKWTH